MNANVGHWIGRQLARTVTAARRHAIAVIAIVAAATAVAGSYTAENLGVNADMDDMISAEMPHRILDMEYQNKFPVLDENAVIVIDGDTPEQARDAAAALAARMRESPEYFKDIYLPQGEFFEEHALLYMDTEDLEDLGDRLARVQPYLAGLAKDGTLRGLADILARGMTAIRDGDIHGDEVVPMLDRFHEAVHARIKGDRYRVSWAEVVAGRDLDVDAKRRFIVVQPVLDFSEVLAAHQAVQAIRRFTHELGLDTANGVRVRMTGAVVLSYEEMILVQKQVAIAGTVSMVLVAILLTVALRSFRLVVATVATLLVGMVWTAAFAALAIGHLNVISVSVFVLFVGLGVGFSLHVAMRYQELMGEGSRHDAALAETARTTGTSVLLCAVTTAIGFYAFVPTDFDGVAELGLIAGTGMFISFALNFTLFPALISLGKRADTTARVRRALPARALPSFPARYPRTVATLALSTGVAAMLVLPELTFDRNPLNVRDPSAESVLTFQELLADATTSPWTLNVLVPDLPSARALAERLDAVPEVERAVTIADYVPEGQEEKLGILEDVAMFMSPPTAGDEEPAPTSADQIRALAKLRIELDHIEIETEDVGLRSSANRLSSALGEFLDRLHGSAASAEEVAALQESLLASLPDQLDSLQRALSAEPITLDTLPAALVERMVSRQGDVRVEIYPSEDLSEDASLDRFVEAVRAVAPQATGSAIGVYEASHAAVGALRQALISAVIVIALLLLVIWRTVGDTLLVMTPLALASVTTAALAVVLDIPFNFADMIVLPLLLGIGVDSGIHLVHRWRLTGARADRLLESSTAHAIVFSALTTIGSFGSLAFTTHRGVASIGQLLTLGVGLMVVANVIILPSLIELRASSLDPSRRRFTAGDPR